MGRREGDKTKERRRDWTIKEFQGGKDTQVVVYNDMQQEREADQLSTSSDRQSEILVTVLEYYTYLQSTPQGSSSTADPRLI